MDNKGAVVLLSGGQDSTVCLGLALNKYARKITALCIDYGQRHKRELKAARDVANIYHVPLDYVTVPGVLKSASPLLSTDTPLEQYTSYDQMQRTIGNRRELTFVAMRNPFMLTVAVNHAIAVGINRVVIGTCRDDAANYPDCTEAFLEQYGRMVEQALGERFEICAPVIRMSKAQIVREAVRLQHSDTGLPAMTALAFSHTAYDGSYPPTGADHATVLRAEGFAAAGFPDPILLRAWVERKLEKFPVGLNYADELLDTYTQRWKIAEWSEAVARKERLDALVGSDGR